MSKSCWIVDDLNISKTTEEIDIFNSNTFLGTCERINNIFYHKKVINIWIDL